jgi:competence protein ComEC
MRTICTMRKYLSPGQARCFLEGLTVGEFHDMLLADHLRHFGLSHIMVVSGFHFSLVALFFGFVLQLLLPWRAAQNMLLLIVTGYFLFIGMAASVARAWLAILLAIIAKSIGRSPSGLNSLGVGLLVLVLYDPTLCLGAGFQLSFIATFAILLNYSLLEAYFEKLFVKRPFEEVSKMAPWDGICHLFVRFFSGSFSLAIAVAIFMIPTCLFIFGFWPLSSIFYNVFFPFMTSIAMFFTFFGLLFSPFWYLAKPFFFFAQTIADWILDTIRYMPDHVSQITVENFSPMNFVLIFTSCCAIGIWLHSKKAHLEASPSLLQYV